MNIKLSKDELVHIKEVCNDLLLNHKYEFSQRDFWTCNELGEEVGLSMQYVGDLLCFISKLGEDFCATQLGKSSYSDFINLHVCNTYRDATKRGIARTQWRIIWLNFVINRCDQYLRGDFKTTDI